MGILIEMPSPRFERMTFKTRDVAIILTKCKKCGARRLVSLADGSLYAWESSHHCASASEDKVTDKKLANASKDAVRRRFWGGGTHDRRT
jgi:hypothetical protein